MATVSRVLPPRPHLDVPKREARALLDDWRRGQPDALARIQHRHPKFQYENAPAIAAASVRLADAQLVIAREYGFVNWSALKERVNANTAFGELRTAIHHGNRDRVVALLHARPEMLHLPVWSGNGGPPMSHAANLGQLGIIQACAELGARDFQPAFERAVLQGQIEAARWLLAHGAKLQPGVVLGACETLNVAGFEFLLELGAPLTNERGDRLAPLALVLETYSRHPVGKHRLLELLERTGLRLPDTPMMAFHRGDVARLRHHLTRDASLLARRFSLPEIYPAECGCAPDGRSGMHWTPLAGTTLLHLALDFQEKEILDWLVSEQADVNARAWIDAEGFGGHTPLFNAVLSHPGADAAMTRTLLESGADVGIRANLRKFIDWCETPRWHVAREVTAAEWARSFPEQNWINREALSLLEAGP